MVEEKKKSQAKGKIEEKKSKKVEEKKSEAKEKIIEKETEVKENKKKVPKKKDVPKKEFAIANGYSLKISPKQSKYVCKILRWKTPENAVKRLQEVIDEKRAIPMAGLEVGHKKGKGLAGGKFPKNSCKAIMEIVKQASANAVVVGIENPIINVIKADRASAPYRRSGQRAKRTHIHIEIRDRVKLMEKKK